MMLQRFNAKMILVGSNCISERQGNDQAELEGLDFSRRLLVLVDVAVDVIHIAGNTGVDTRAVGDTTTPMAHDANLHEATICATHQRATVVPLKHKTGEDSH